MKLGFMVCAVNTHISEIQSFRGLTSGSNWDMIGETGEVILKLSILFLEHIGALLDDLCESLPTQDILQV